MRRSVLFLLLLLGGGVFVFGQPVPQEHYGDIAQKIARMLPSYHLSQRPLNDEISQKAWTNLLNAFDFDRSYFLQ